MIKNKLFKLKTTNQLSELIQLAIEDHQKFLIQFQDAYPEYYKTLLEINPKLTKSELNLGAYIYFGFSSKEIAYYTFRSLKTIESTRYNFRKKLGLSPDVKLEFWLRKLIKGNN